ncbi:MAG TPA: hypothetical protein DEW46_16480 [Verrucomicrobia bacterium]|nr:hypothetical protein [Verrucomicrobiota bacterium]
MKALDSGRARPRACWAKAGDRMGGTRAEARRRRGGRRGDRVGEESRNVGAVFGNCLGQQARENPGISPKRVDQRIGLSHPHNQVENALAPLRLCASFSGAGGAAFIFSEEHEGSV